MKILLVSNYINDRQESMQRFAEMLDRGLKHRGHEVCCIAPKPYFGLLKPSASGIGKWLGYMDKFVCFPRALRERLHWADVVHICDHANAFYMKHLIRAEARTVVTCHDLLAVRGALGEDTDCPASATGKILQSWILKGLQMARAIACVSTYTRNDAERLVGAGPRVRVVPNGLNHDYKLLNVREADARLARANLDSRTSYILHVGSNQRRKNRDGVIRIFEKIHRKWPGNLVLAGEALSHAQRARLDESGLSDRVLHIGKPSNDLLEALYNRAHALLFPSRFEGFGWPIVEAQACGCPVVCSDACSMPEVAGDGAMLRAIDDEDGFASDLLKLCDRAERNKWIERGLQNIQRFSAGKMIDQYLDFYQEQLS